MLLNLYLNVVKISIGNFKTKISYEIIRFFLDISKEHQNIYSFKVIDCIFIFFLKKFQDYK